MSNEHLDETISSSPKPVKRLSDSIVHRKCKRKRINDEIESTNLNNTIQTANLETTKLNFDLSLLYWDDDDSDTEIQFVPNDIFAEEKLLEKANLEKSNTINNYEKFITNGFETVTQFSQRFNLNDKQVEEVISPETQFTISETLFENLCNENHKIDKPKLEVMHEIYDEGAGCSKFISPLKCTTAKTQKFINEIVTVPVPGPETQFGISEIEFVKFCNENDEGAGCSRLISPIKCTTPKTQKTINDIITAPVPGPETQFGISEIEFAKFCNDIEEKVDENMSKKIYSPKIETLTTITKSNSPNNSMSSLTQSIFDDFSELEDPNTISTLITPKSTPQFQFRNKILRTYSRNRIEKLKRSQRSATIINLETIYDSDCSQSSGLSIQNDEIDLNVTVQNNLIQLEISQQICDNLLSLGTFFSESFINENLDEKIKKNIKKFIEPDRNWMLEYYRNKRNFKFSTNIQNDEDFKGFSDSDDDENEYLYDEENVDMNQDNINNEYLNDNKNLNMNQDNIDLFNEIDNNFNGFTQALLDKSFIDVDQQNLFDLISKNEVPENIKNSSKICEKDFEDSCFKKPLTYPSKALSTPNRNNYDKITSSEMQFPEENLNDDIFNSELWQDEDILTRIKTQNLCNISNKLESKENENFKCQIPLNSKLNGLRLETEVIKPNSPLTQKSHDIIENQIFEGFKFASKKPVKISENALKNAEKLVNEVLTEDCKKLENVEEDKENNLIPKEVKFKTASDKSIKINEDALLYAKEFFNDIDIESFTDDFDFDRNSPKKNIKLNDNLNKSISPKNHLLEANNFLNGISAEITQTPQFVSFKSGLGKPINISEKSLLKAKKFITETNTEIYNELLKTDDSFKVPTFVGFTSGKGKPIKISEKALEKAAKMMEEINKEIVNENLNISEENELESRTKQNDIELNVCKENEIQKDPVENVSKENKIQMETIEINLNNSQKEIRKPLRRLRKSKNNSAPDESHSIRVTRSSSRINTKTNSPLESIKVENVKSPLKNITHQENTTLKNNGTPLSEKSFTNQTEISKNSLNNSSISTPLSHKSIISRSQSSVLTPLGTRKNILSLSRRYFKTPTTTIRTPNLDENACTPIRNYKNTPITSNVHIETPNLNKFFNSVNSIATSTPKICSTQLTLTKEITPSAIAIMENEMKNSSINNDDDMKMINWNDRDSVNLSRTLSLTNKISNKISPSPKMRIDRLNMLNKPPALLPLAFIDTCKPSGLIRKNNFINKLDNHNISLENEINDLCN